MADEFDEDAVPKIGFFERNFPSLGGVLKFFLIVVGVLLVAFTVTVVTLNIVGSRRLRDARARAAQAMVPLTSEAYYLKYPKPGDEGNAANYYRAAFMVLRAKGSSRPDDLTRIENGAPTSATDPLSEEYVTALREVFGEYGLATDLVLAGAHLPRASYEVDPGEPMALVPHLVDARRCGRLLSLAVLLAAEEKRGGDGIALARAGFALSRSLEREPGLISALVGMAISSITLSDNLQRLVSFTEVSDEDLAVLQRDLERCAAEYSIRPVLEGEIVQLCAIFEMLQKDPAGLTQAFGGDSAFMDKALVRMPAWAKSGYFKCDEAYAINYFLDTLGEIDAKPVGYVPTRLSGGAKPPEQTWFFVSRMLLPAHSRSLITSESHRARLRATATAIAALRFRKANGRWPDALEELVGAYIEAVPKDPFTGRPLVYKVLDDGIAVYSVGENGRDDGGKPGAVKLAPGEMGPYDDNAGFRIWHRMPEEEDGGGGE